MLLKFALFAFLIMYLNQVSALTGGISDTEANDTVNEIALWTLDKISQYTGITGTYTIANIKNIQTQVVSGL